MRHPIRYSRKRFIGYFLVYSIGYLLVYTIRNV